MSQKSRRPAADYAVYLAARLFVCVAQAVPVRAAFALADLLAAAAYRFDRRHRAVAAENLRHAFPEKPPAEIDRLVWGCFRHFCGMLVEIVLLPRKFRVTNWRSFAGATTPNLGPAVREFLTDRPVLIVTGHFGNWELAGYAFGAFGFKTHAIARVLDNPHLERFLKQFRQATGQTVIAKKDDFDRLTGVLSAGGKVATLADQDAGPRGVFVDFFGRPASTHKAVALMAIEFGAKLAVVGVPRTAVDPVSADGQWRPGYRIVCEEVIDPAGYTGRPDAVAAITARYSAALERLIRRHPEQYFWLHRRWKSQPAARRAGGVAPRAAA
jgi:KDO2-lipid IV(A) lauroyltransferase